MVTFADNVINVAFISIIFDTHFCKRVNLNDRARQLRMDTHLHVCAHYIYIAPPYA